MSAMHATRGPAAGRYRGYWPAVAGLVLVFFAAVLPELTAGRYLYVETIQFTAYAIVIPALVVLGAPWTPRFARLPLRGAVAVAAVYIGVCLAWRLPPQATSWRARESRRRRTDKK